MRSPETENAAPACPRSGVRDVLSPSPDAPFRKTPEPVSEYHMGGAVARLLPLTVFPHPSGRTKQDMPRSLVGIASAITTRVSVHTWGPGGL